MKQRLRNGGFVNNEDMISHLPEALHLRILSLLATKNLVATSVLSKQWRSLWKMVPKLKFDQHMNQSGHKFSETVSRVLLSHKAPLLESLHLCFNPDDIDPIDIGMWVGIAYGRHVRELLLEIHSEYGPSFKFPKSLYNSETLETLILRIWFLVDVPSQVCLKSLKTLHLYKVDYENDASVLNLLSGCPKLENLLVERGDVDVKTFIISVPSLQRLTMKDTKGGDASGGFVINTPSLKYLEIRGLIGLESFLIENAKELVEANIMNVSKMSNENILGSLASAKSLSLSLSPLEITYPTGSIFYRLVYLKLYTYKAEWWNLLLLMLDASPKLQVLILNGHWMSEKDRIPCEKWNQRKNVSECKLLHLETFVWNGYKEQLEEEKEVAKYILRNANRLKRATFSIKGIDSDERVEMIEELESVVRASDSSCKLLLL